MGLRTKVDFSVSVGFDNDLSDTAFERNISELLDTVDRVKTATYSLDAAEADTEVSFDDVAEARLVIIEADGEITYKVNGINNQVRTLSRMVAPASSQAPTLKAYALMTEVCTSLHLTNPSVTDKRQVKVCIVGDLTA